MTYLFSVLSNIFLLLLFLLQTDKCVSLDEQLTCWYLLLSSSRSSWRLSHLDELGKRNPRFLHPRCLLTYPFSRSSHRLGRDSAICSPSNKLRHWFGRNVAEKRRRCKKTYQIIPVLKNRLPKGRSYDLVAACMRTHGVHAGWDHQGPHWLGRNVAEERRRCIWTSEGKRRR